MADFLPAFEMMMRNEGGYRLTNIPGDSGGQTYAGISRRRNPRWPGWASIDAGETPDTSDVRAFYKSEYWDAVQGDGIEAQTIAASIFDFGVNAGTKVSVKLAQLVVGATPDGVVGPRTIAMLNTYDPAAFQTQFALAKIKRYLDICNTKPDQTKFLRGWLNRTFKGLACS